MHEPAAVAVEEFVRDAFGERGVVMVRIGKAAEARDPVPDEHAVQEDHRAADRRPMAAMTRRSSCSPTASRSSVDGEHPETHKPYCWHGGTPWDIPRADLPYLAEAEARALVENAVSILADFGYARAASMPARAQRQRRQRRQRR